MDAGECFADRVPGSLYGLVGIVHLVPAADQILEVLQRDRVLNGIAAKVKIEVEPDEPFGGTCLGK